MPQMDVVASCSHSTFGHLMHPLCPEQSGLEKTAKVVVPLFVLLGGIYYAWKYFNPTISSEQQNNAVVTEKRVLDEVFDSAAGSKASQSTKSEESPEDTFNNQLKGNDLKLARETMRQIIKEDPSKSDDLRRRYIVRAVALDKFEEAFPMVTQLSDESTRKNYLALLAGKISLNLELVKEMLIESRKRSLYSKSQPLIIGEVISALIDKEHLKSALDLAIALKVADEMDPYIERIFNAFLQKEDFGKADEAKEKIFDIDMYQTINAAFINAAIEKGKYLHAAGGIRRVRDRNTENTYCERLALKIVERPDWVSKSRSFSTYDQGLYARVIPLLIGRTQFADAETWTQRIYDHKEKNDWLNKIKDARLAK